MKHKQVVNPGKVMLGIVILAFFVSFVLNSLITTGTSPRDALDSYIQVNVLRADGSLDEYEKNTFDMVNKGDTIQAKIYLPEEMRIKDPALCFHCYHCVLTLKYQDEVLYTYGQDLLDANRSIGAVHATVSFPEEAFGSYLTLEAYSTENGAENRLVNYTVVPATQALRYYITGNVVNFAVFLACMILGIGASIGIFMYYIVTRRGRDLLIVMTFIATISLYVLCYYGMINYILFDPKIAADLEYISLFLLPVPACAFFTTVFEKSGLHRYFKVGTFISLLVFVICTLIHYSPFWWFHYTSMLVVAHIEILALAISVIIACIIYKTEKEWTRLVQAGTLLYASIIIVELVRFVVSRFLPIPRLIYKVSLLPFSFLELIFTLLVSTIVHQFAILRQEQEQIQLKRLAYQDVLTGLMSRTRCEEYCRLLEEEQIKDFTVFYLDLNHLKTANDKFGHEYGDHYLQKTAEILQDVFESADIISRMGGDEFVVIFGKDIRWKIQNMCNRLEEAFEDLRSSGVFPFDPSIAYGYASSTGADPHSIEEIMKSADAHMYEKKQAMR